eukprot:CAMPEP_0168621778 /NCGR_PEP_ID=MMETSP0449_2-20121227/7891_1 /TAXON_ID=1082188 /ORGANISM="Strombidium rassoulzadegani, Strain ras09" /LENGTH=118 /DNA_ID=CAMNT_0008662951 /DNA_START=97 /DNA_END=453 /DNA_ORIENTATION=-
MELEVLQNIDVPYESKGDQLAAAQNISPAYAHVVYDGESPLFCLGGLDLGSILLGVEQGHNLHIEGLQEGELLNNVLHFDHMAPLVCLFDSDRLAIDRVMLKSPLEVEQALSLLRGKL